MIPIRDTSRSRNYPAVTMLIIAVNVFLYLVELAQGPALDQLILTYGLIPARYTVPEISAYFTPGQQLIALSSFMFLHGSFWHLLGNMWSLHIFGDNVEDRLGPIRYLLFYLCCGWVSGFVHLFTNWNSQVPTIGASGAIAGVMGAYLLLYPRARILTLIPILFIPYFVEIPAYFFLGFWFFLQFLNAMGSSGQAGGIAWFAHIGGFLIGMALLKVFSGIPALGITRHVRRKTAREKTPRLHLIRSAGAEVGTDLHDRIIISPMEARMGTQKIISVPWGLQRKLFRVRVPPGITNGAVLRLQGVGSPGGDGRDLYLEVLIEP